jgi:uncharacterized RDD family membrane protein YckC
LIAFSEDLVLAKWKDRFVAWLIDFVIVSVIIGIASVAAHQFNYFMQAEWYASTSMIFFAYWVFLEYGSGQSLGKRLMRLKTVNLDGTSLSFVDSAVNSFGKAFLLPVDVILGLIFTDKKRQRIFNRLSNTIVIKIPEPENEEISYKLD